MVALCNVESMERGESRLVERGIAHITWQQPVTTHSNQTNNEKQIVEDHVEPAVQDKNITTEADETPADGINEIVKDVSSESSGSEKTKDQKKEDVVKPPIVDIPKTPSSSVTNQVCHS